MLCVFSEHKGTTIIQYSGVPPRIECMCYFVKRIRSMGYSTPKKQLDLKEFLSTPAKRLPYKKKFSQMQVERKPASETEEKQKDTK